MSEFYTTIFCSSRGYINYCFPVFIFLICNSFKGSKKSTPFAAQSVAEKVASLAFDAGMRKAEVVICGPGNGRDTAIRALQGCGLEILLIKLM